MSFKKAKVKDFYLFSTDVENIFINEYMPGAPGDYVKVYLYGLLYAQTGAAMDDATFAKQLRLPAEAIEKAWKYWEEMGIVRCHRRENAADPQRICDVEFRNLRAMMYGSGETQPQDTAPESKTAERIADKLRNREVKDFILDLENCTGRLFDPQKELPEILSWEKDFHTSKELILKAFAYCSERQKTGLAYIKKVVMGWSERGLRTAEDVDAFLEEAGIRQARYKRVLQSLGMNRGATEAEKRMMDTWFEDMHYEMERVLEACDRTLSTTNPNLRYVNKVLENWYEEAKARGLDVNQKVTVTQAVLNKYYEFLRGQAEKKAQEHRQEVYQKLPRIEQIDTTRSELGSRLARGMLTGMDAAQKAEIRQQMRGLEEERAFLLTENNYPIDYTDVRYSCEKCGDTGFDENGQRCSCAGQRTGEAELWQKRNTQTSAVSS